MSTHHVRVTVNGEVKEDRKSTRLNSSHVEISYAVFCLKKKKELQARKQLFVGDLEHALSHRCAHDLNGILTLDRVYVDPDDPTRLCRSRLLSLFCYVLG